MHAIRNICLLLAAGSIGACATIPAGGPPSGDAMARLEQQQRLSPASAEVNRALGIAYYQGQHYVDARRALETAARLDSADGTTALYLGLTAEAQDDLPAARAAYASYLNFGRTTRVRAQLQSRLASLTRRQLALDAKAAVAREATMGNEPGSPRIVAVMPMRFTGADSSLRPLERGFSDLLITDLSRSPALTLVERGRLEALLHELSLADNGVTDATTSARAGRLLRAGRVVQGALLQLSGTDGATRLRADAAVVDVGTSSIRGTAQGNETLDQLFALEKGIALGLFEQLGVTLTTAQRNAIEQRPTRSLAAFLAYSRGLTAEDAGRYDDASRYFNEALRMDPGFGAALQRGSEAQSLSAGATTASVQASTQGGVEGQVAAAAATGQATASGASGGVKGTLGSLSSGLNSSAAEAATAGAAGGAAAPATPGKDPVSAGLNSDNASSIGHAVISIVLPRRP